MVWKTDKGTAAYRKKVMSVSCDRHTCLAAIGKPCLYEDSSKPQRGFHSSREMKALAIVVQEQDEDLEYNSGFDQD